MNILIYTYTCINIYIHTRTHIHTYIYSCITRVKHLIHLLVCAFSYSHSPLTMPVLRHLCQWGCLQLKYQETQLNVLSSEGIYYFTDKKSGRQSVHLLVKSEVLPFHPWLGSLPSFLPVPLCVLHQLKLPSVTIWLL